MTAEPPVDPVCRMTLAKWNVEFDRTHAGTVYHFCSPECASSFAECPDGYSGAGPHPVPRRTRERVTLPVFGLDREGRGSNVIQQKLLRTPGVLWAYANPLTEMAYVEYHSAVVTHDDLIDVIEDLGYSSLRAERRERRATPRIRDREAGTEGTR